MMHGARLALTACRAASLCLSPRRGGTVRHVMTATAASLLRQEELFEFDLNGYLVVRGALSAEEVKGLHSAIDA